MKVDNILISASMLFFIICGIMTGVILQITDLALRGQLFSMMSIIFLAGIALVILLELVILFRKMIFTNT